MPILPIDPDQYPTEYEPLDESITYKVVLRAFDFSPKLDKNNNEYLNGMVEVIEPESYAGIRLYIPYVGIPPQITDAMSEGEKFQARRAGMTFAQVCKCFGIKSGPNGIDTDAALGNSGFVAIENETYKGRKQSKIKEFLFVS